MDIEMIAATHSGKFHADDVLAWALLVEFYPAELSLLRTRIEKEIENADIVFDVGGDYNPSTKRFDHHQQSYQGNYSSAGMVLDWLHQKQYIDTQLFQNLKTSIVRYVDDVDNGRILPNEEVPCFPIIVDSFNHGCTTLEEFDNGFHQASKIAKTFIQQLKKKIQQEKEAETLVLQAMEKSTVQNSNIIELPRYLPWKSIYFSNGGKTHHTEYVIFPTLHKTWQAVAIPPEEQSFAQKRSFPASWAGLRDNELSKAIGVEGAIFCHKNRFVAVFTNRNSLLSAMKQFNLIHSI